MKMKKKLLITLGVLVVLLLGLGFGLQTWLKSWVNRARLVAEMEKGWNCRAELANTSLSIFASPAWVELRGLQLAPRDGQAARPLDSRTPFDPSKSLLTADRIGLAVTLSDLLHRTAHVRQLRIDGFTLKDEVNEVVDENGEKFNEGLLDVLFEHPDDYYEDEAPERKSAAVLMKVLHDIHQPSPAGHAIAQAAGDDKPKAGDETKPRRSERKKHQRKKREHKPFKASDLAIALEAEEASVQNAKIDLVDHPHATRTLMERVHLSLKDLDVTPTDLANHNRCSLDLGGDIRVEQASQTQPMVNFTLDATGFIRPFDVESGEWNPDLTLTVKVKKGAVFGGAPLKSQLKPKDAKNLADWGIDLGDVALGGVLGEDTGTQVHLFNHKTVVKDDTRLVFPQYEITLHEKSWFNAHEDVHNVNCTLLLGKELSDKILDQVQKNISAKYTSAVGSVALAAVKQVLMDDKGRLEIKVRSKGSISKPSIDWDNPLSDVKDLLKDVGASILNGLIK